MNEKDNKEKNKIQLAFFIKIGLVCLLILVLLIPLGMIHGVIEEREQTRLAAEQEIIQMWGGTQTLAGPILAVPYHYFTEEKVQEKDGIKTTKTKIVTEAYFLPEKLLVDGSIPTETRNLGIYDVTIYNSGFLLSGIFTRPDFSDYKDEVAEENIHWDEAYLFIELPEMRAINGPVTLNWNGQTFPFKGDTAVIPIFEGSIKTKIPLMPTKNTTNQYQFSINLKLRGSKSIWFIPLGNETEVNLGSTWPSPGFKGNFLPQPREFNEKGFTAHWAVASIARGFPQHWLAGELDSRALTGSQFGVELVIPVDSYAKIVRAVKYGILFILITFVVFFLFEVLAAKRIHFFQYILVGLALCIFYLLLLSLSEHIGFPLSYLLASLGAIILITCHSQAFLLNWKRALLVGVILGALYIYLYVILQLEDYALLIGSLGLFMILGIIMFVTRRINWYELKMNPVEVTRDQGKIS
jgi:inner membrane protein